ncbi:MAG TPA: hypothetical protein VF120_15555 [Ktedonobacterales bacterium]
MDNTSSRGLPQRWMLALGAAGIFLAGLLLGAVGSGHVFAASQTTAQNSSASTTLHVKAAAVGTPFVSPQEAQNYCQLYEQTVLGDLKTDGFNVSVAQLEGANYDAITAVLNKMVADKKITQAQETQIAQQLALLQSNPCQNLSQLGKGAAPSASQQQALMGARSAILDATAKALHLSSANLQSDLTAGQTVAQVAAGQNVPIATVNQAYLGAVGDQLKTAVANGMITQAQADQLSAMVQTAVNAGHYPLLDGGSFGG